VDYLLSDFSSMQICACSSAGGASQSTPDVSAETVNVGRRWRFYFYFVTSKCYVFLVTGRVICLSTRASLSFAILSEVLLRSFTGCEVCLSRNLGDPVDDCFDAEELFEFGVD